MKSHAKEAIQLDKPPSLEDIVNSLGFRIGDIVAFSLPEDPGVAHIGIILNIIPDSNNSPAPLYV